MSYLRLTSLALTAMATTLAGTVTFDTTGTILSCGTNLTCIQQSATTVTVGGITLVYNTQSATGVTGPAIAVFGNVIAVGTGTNVDLTGLTLTLNVNVTPPTLSGTIPVGTFSGTLSTASSAATIIFSPNNNTTTAAFGTLPGVVLGPNTFQVLNPRISVVAPSVGGGITTVTGGISTSTPEPATWTFLIAGAGSLFLTRRKFRKL